ncbi:11410_t:CDS:1, partial [Entrophospora sp. SA101]
NNNVLDLSEFEAEADLSNISQTIFILDLIDIFVSHALQS